MVANGITVLKHNVPWGPFTRAQIDDGLARGDFTLQYLAHAPGLSEWLPLGEVLDHVARRESSPPTLPPVPPARDMPPIPPRPTVTVPAPISPPAPKPGPPDLPAAPPKIAAPEPAKPQSPPVGPPPQPHSAPPELEPAPIFLRTIAFLIDCGVISSPIVLLFVFGILSIYVPTWFRHESAQEIDEARALLWLNTRRMAAWLIIGCGWLYAAWWESSAKQATIGKRWMGLRVVDENGERVSFLRASARYAAKYLSALPCFLGFIMALFSSRGRALHDRLAGTCVVRE